MENIFNEDNIIALATPAGTGAISVVRMSGPEAIGLIDRVFIGKKKFCVYGNI